VAKKVASPTKTARKQPRVFTVRWRKQFYFYYDRGERRQPGNRYVKAFISEEAATEYIRALLSGEIPPPLGANPFMGFRRCKSFGDVPELDSLTSFPEPIFLDYIRDLGIEPPPLAPLKPRYGDKEIVLRDWDGWWEQHALGMTNEQRSAIWKALDRLDFYEIVQTSFA
jgi:hypothetical protein